ncbi:acid protease [Diplogelasinospora grovesii]|uniref:Acid protease n=1 Tax=Diplogelasinospora grovesii TaxID=303347 RepID=A0AAN6N2T4_9PEZI|nr:acid protease [Diplogelasinospora grovesii]
MQSSLFSILLFGLLASWAAAAPSNIQKRSFKVERVKNANFQGRNGPKELFKAYRKYSMPVPQGLMDALRNPGSASGAVAVEDVETKAQGSGKGKGKAGKKAAQGQNNNAAQGTNSSTANAAQQNTTAGVGKVANTPETGDIEYLAPVTIGGQTVNLDFDSGSSDLWVFNTQLAAQSTTGHTLFDPTKSTTFKMIQGASFSISYGDGSGAAGNVGTDTVNIGGATVTKQAIELATAVSTSFVQDTQNNGLVGLAFSKLNTVKPQQQKTFFDNVMPSLAEPLFTADLRKNAAGAYEFGRVDTTKFTGQMAWVPVNTTNGFWQFATSGFAVGASTSINKTATAQAIADTGTTLMLVSQATADGYYSQVPGAANNAQVGGITVPCNATLPDLLVDVGGVYTARVKGEDINFAQVQGNTCFGGVQPTTSDLQIWGDIFFKSQFVAFNGGNNSLGMAQHV